MSEFIIREYDYAIRIVAYLAGLKEKIKIDEIAENLFLNKPMVNKIIFQLKNCNIVLTKTGKNGGILLNPDFKNLSLYDILVCMGFRKSLNVCVDKPEECKLNPICKITSFFSNLQNELINELKNAQVKDFIFDKEQIEKLKK
jgi:Rrf2 family nitric oxide-sensitive transcriptional repressor